MVAAARASFVMIVLRRALAGLPEGYPSVPMNGIHGRMSMPLVGLGTWEFDSDTAEQAIMDAFKVGYRHVDTAAVYGNQAGVGKALVQAQAANMLKREEYFITTKIPAGRAQVGGPAGYSSCAEEPQTEALGKQLRLVQLQTHRDGNGSSVGGDGASGLWGRRWQNEW